MYLGKKALNGLKMSSAKFGDCSKIRIVADSKPPEGQIIYKVFSDLTALLLGIIVTKIIAHEVRHPYYLIDFIDILPK